MSSDDRTDHSAYRAEVIDHMQRTGDGAAETAAHFLETLGVEINTATIRGWRKREVDLDLLAASAVWAEHAKLVPWELNPRINDHAVEPLARGIWRHGFDQAIVVWSRYSRVCKGHTRLKAVRFLESNVPTLDDEGRITGWRPRADADGPYQVLGAPRPGLVPVVWRDFADEAAFRAAALADNRLGEISTWADDATADLLREIDAQGRPELLDMGWSEEDLRAISAPAPLPDPAPLPGPAGRRAPPGARAVRELVFDDAEQHAIWLEFELRLVQAAPEAKTTGARLVALVEWCGENMPDLLP